MSNRSGNDVVQLERHGRVLVATMDDGRANALTTTMSQGLRAAITEAENDPDLGAVVIAGRPGRFCAGFDLGVIRSGDRDAIRTMVQGGGELVRHAYGAAVPVVAACTGHAVAAGALLLLGCDQRVGPDTDAKIGLNEVAIGLTLPTWALAIAEERISRRHLQTSVVNARLYSGADAVDAGFLDVVVEDDQVLPTALERAAVLAQLDPGAYAATVSALRGRTLDRMAAGA